MLDILGWTPTPYISILEKPFLSDFLAIIRSDLSADQAATLVSSINAGTLTESQFVDNLLSQAANTTIPAIAVEASMYGTVRTSAEVTLLASQFLPAQVANATSQGFNPLVYASEALGLAFAFGNEAGSTAFATAFGPTHAGMPNSTAGDAAFAAAASTAIFGSASTANLVQVMEGFVSNWKTFFTQNGIPGVSNANEAQIDLAARGTAWGDMAGVALANKLGPLSAQVTNFLEDATQGTAVLLGVSFESAEPHRLPSRDIRIRCCGRHNCTPDGRSRSYRSHRDDLSKRRSAAPLAPWRPKRL